MLRYGMPRRLDMFVYDGCSSKKVFSPCSASPMLCFVSMLFCDLRRQRPARPDPGQRRGPHPLASGGLAGERRSLPGELTGKCSDLRCRVGILYGRTLPSNLLRQ